MISHFSCALPIAAVESLSGNRNVADPRRLSPTAERYRASLMYPCEPTASTLAVNKYTWTSIMNLQHQPIYLALTINHHA